MRLIAVLCACFALAGLASSAASQAPSPVVRAGVTLDPQGLIPAPLLDEALASLNAHQGQVTFTDAIGVVDLSADSFQKRFYVLDLKTGAVSAYRVSNGKGSDPDHNGLIDPAPGKRNGVSNAKNTQATSSGAFLMAENRTHNGWAARGLDGLDPSNSNARARQILVHGASYVTDAWIKEHGGVVGRSCGCFALPPQDLAAVFAMLPRGALIYAGPASVRTLVDPPQFDCTG